MIARPEGDYKVVTTTFFANTDSRPIPITRTPRSSPRWPGTRADGPARWRGYVDPAAAVKDGHAETEDEAVRSWFDQLSRVSGLAPFLPVLSQGDRSSDIFSRVELPTESTAYGSYSFDVALTHFVALNTRRTTCCAASDPTGSAHLAWLEADIADARARGSATS